MIIIFQKSRVDFAVVFLEFGTDEVPRDFVQDLFGERLVLVFLQIALKSFDFRDMCRVGVVNLL